MLSMGFGPAIVTICAEVGIIEFQACDRNVSKQEQPTLSSCLCDTETVEPAE
jgi:hypothetical protein